MLCFAHHLITVDSALRLPGTEEALLLLKSLFVVLPDTIKRCIFLNQQTLNDSKKKIAI